MRGVGVLHELDRQRWSGMPCMLEPAVKRSWRIDGAGQLPRTVSQAFNAMRTGPGRPVMIDLPMDVQAETIEGAVDLLDSSSRRPHDRQAGTQRSCW